MRPHWRAAGTRRHRCQLFLHPRYGAPAVRMAAYRQSVEDRDWQAALLKALDVRDVTDRCRCLDDKHRPEISHPPRRGSGNVSLPPTG